MTKEENTQNTSETPQNSAETEMPESGIGSQFNQILEEVAQTQIEAPALSATVGEPLSEGTEIADKEAIIGALKAVQDPELLLDIHELGLIYDIKQEKNGDVSILMTLTSPTCPIAGDMPSMVANAVSSVQGVGRVTVELTFDPPWTTDRLSDEIKLMMGF